ncbi:MAG: hypothetical protein DMG96_08865 [Acidobacteria bacterium]|nr:MAG: hypothetical protein DMG96_08865 [Acidobacteriota bacterium]
MRHSYFQDGRRPIRAKNRRDPGAFAEIVQQLQSSYTFSDAELIKREAGDFLEQLHGKRIVDF